MLRDIQEKISEIWELWGKLHREVSYGLMTENVRQYVEDICGLGAWCEHIDIYEWYDYSDAGDTLDEIASSVDSWAIEGFKFNIIARTDEYDADFYITIPDEVYWKGPGAWQPFVYDHIYELDGDNIEIEAKVIPCPMQ